jgi:hypothetical protein
VQHVTGCGRAAAEIDFVAQIQTAAVRSCVMHVRACHKQHATDTTIPTPTYV